MRHAISVHRLLQLAALAGALLLTACGDPEPPPPVTAPVETCEVGSLGCACASGDVCGASAAGEALQCRDDVCAPMSCLPGETGCVCRGGTACDDAGDTCGLGVCKPTDCEAGSADCDCLLGECGANLYCDTSLGGGTCVDGTGFPGGACPANELCHNQSRCDRDTNTCVHCELGSQGCAPDRGVCNSGLVYAVGRCLPRNEVPPDAPKCYTRCTGDVRTSDGLLVCDPEGFLAGCLPGLACQDGSCVPAGDERPSCAGDSECPDHQSCLVDGHCYSNCDASADCPTGLACHDHVCRMPCAATAAPGQGCPEDARCDMEDGQSGFCMPRPAGPDPDQPTSTSTATYKLSRATVALTLLEPAAEVAIATQSQTAERFTISKKRHRVFDRQGQPIVDARAVAEPAWFLTLSSPSATPRPGGALDVVAEASCGDRCPVLRIAQGAAIPPTWARFEAAVEVRSPTLGAQTIEVSFQASVDGRWTGSMYYFASFPDVRLAEWRAGDRAQDNDVGNGLVARWAAYRNGRLNGFDELQAVLNATTTGSWEWPSVTSACSAGSTAGACYLFDTDGTTAGLRQYVDNLGATPIPTGVTEYPIAMNLRHGALDGAGRFTMTGAIDSAVALHYGGNPRVDLAFFHRPDDVARCGDDGITGDCVSYLADFSSDIYVGARVAAVNGVCPAGLQLTRIPWLVPGFTEGTRDGYREECREIAVPFAAGDPRNANLTVGNPVADGRSMKRQLRLVDGAMIDQERLFILFEETVASSLRGPPIANYGFMLLARSGQPVTDPELLSSTTGTSTRGVSGPLPGRTSCQAAMSLARSHLPPGLSLPANLSDHDRATLMLTGRIPGTTPQVLSGVHYLCVDTGRFDGGAQDTGAPGDERLACPASSNVRFFVLPAPHTQASVAALPCQDDGTCGVQLEQWVTSSLAVTLDPVWSCVDPTASSCSTNRFDLRDGKRFYAPGPSVFLPLEPAVEDAFRYKAKFRSSRDRSVGFAPVQCVGSGALTPYCYDAATIEETAARVDCLLSTYASRVTEWHGDQWLALRGFLATSLSVHEAAGPSAPPGLDGFERLNSELLTMLGDDALTHALASRFDLAAANGASFLGAQFETNGMTVGGIAGYEMRELHEAVQYYEQATDRFFTKVAPVVFAAIKAGDVGANHVVSPLLVSTYLERLIGSSAKKATAWSFIADRYRGFDRPDLARAVMQRAYMGTYVESMLLSRIMLDIADHTDAANRDGLVAILKRTQRQYGSALTRMREAYERITQDGERFGFSPDFIPFPAVDDTDTRYANAFEAALGLARQRADTARRFEDMAVAGRREFETDAASFQSELVSISVAKEARLAEICGSFNGDDGRVHPAIRRYAYLDDRTALMGDPCGFVGIGELHDRMTSISLLQADAVEFRRRVQHINDRIGLENQRVEAQCHRLGDLRDLQVREMGERRTLQETISRLENGVSLVERSVNNFAQSLMLSQCAADCPAVPNRTWAFLLAAAVGETAILDLQDQVIERQADLVDSQIEELKAQLDSECHGIQIDSAPVLADLVEQIHQLDHDVRQTMLKVRMDLDSLSVLRLEARRIEQEEIDAEELAIDVEAARNDPNIRVYMNTAMINADGTFNRALDHAFRATRLLEYYKSASYGHAAELYLIRMISRGEYNLDDYLDDLEDDYEAFRRQYRNRSRRAIRLSLANDIMHLPTLADDGRSLNTDERDAMFRERLLDPTRLDSQGRRTFEFRTSLEDFAPCTFGHQIEYVEVMLSGNTLGDPNSSVMLWQNGTGIVERPDGGANFHRLPPALIVATPRRDVDSAFDLSVYRNYTMRERPLVNTSWSLVFDETHPQNRDVRFDELGDIYVYIYYTDFTNPDACR